MLGRCNYGLTRIPYHRAALSKYASEVSNTRLRRSYSSLEPGVSHDVAVLGGGVTGLATAYYITQQLPRAKVTIYEASDRIGGWLQSKRVSVRGGSVLFEAGPRTLRTAGNGILAARLVQELDLANDTVFTMDNAPAGRNRYLYWPDHLVRMPHPSHGLFNILWNFWREPIFDSVLWSSLTEPAKDPRDASVRDESIGDFFSRRFNAQMVDRILSGLIHGIYAGDVWQLSAKSLFPKQWRGEIASGSVFRDLLRSRTEGFEMTKHESDFLQEIQKTVWDERLWATLRRTSVFTFKDGLGMLVDRLARKLMETGKVSFKTNAKITKVSNGAGDSSVEVECAKTDEQPSSPTSYSHVVSTLSPGALSTSVEPQILSNQLASIPTVTVMTVNLYYALPGLHPEGFGYLIPAATPFEQNPERALGVVFDDAYTPPPTHGAYSSASSEDQMRDNQAEDVARARHFEWYNYPEKPAMQDELQPPGGSKMTVMLGGHWWNGWPAFPDEQEGLEMAKSVLQRHLGVLQEPEAYKVNLQKDCIPQYVVGHEAKLKDIHNELWRGFRGRLRVAGNWMAGVGVNDCLRSAWDTAKSLREGKQGTGLEHVGTQEYVRMKAVTRVRQQKPKEEEH